MNNIPYTRPSITNLETEYATDAAANGWGEKCYDYIIRFEKEFAHYIGAKFGIATSSCTGAMTMGLGALGIGHGDEIILADTNWIATASPIVHCGATPVFVDILKDTWCIDPEQVEFAITNKTKAIIATHLYGNLCDMDRLAKISTKYNIPIIEDAAEAMGSVYKGKRAGSIGVFSTFSFHGTKTMTTGEGGIFLTNDEILYEKVLTISNHGRSRNQKKQFWADEFGHKFKMSNIQAALGCAQLSRIEELVSRKKEILDFYKTELSNCRKIHLNPDQPDSVIGAWMPNIVFSLETKVTREDLLNEFRQNKIDARVFFWPLSSLPMFEPIIKNKNAYSIPKRAINLPSYHDMTEQDLARVVTCLRDVIDKNNSFHS